MKTKKVWVAVVMLLAVLFFPIGIAAEDGEQVYAPTIVNIAHYIDAGTISSLLAIPSDIPRGPQDLLQDYEQEMFAVTQQFSARLAGIAQAVSNGQLTGERGEEIAREQYQIAQMQFGLLDALHTMLAQNLASTSLQQPATMPSSENEIVMVALPFSSLQLNSLVAQQLGLSPEQSKAIQDLMSEERKNLQPLMNQLQATKLKLLAVTDRGQIDQREVQSLATLQAQILGKLIVRNSRLQAKVYKLMSPDQQKKLDELKRQYQPSLQ